MKITLIGASGFVGTRLITLLKKAQRYEMLNIDLQQSRFFPEVTAIGDVRDQDYLDKKLEGVNQPALTTSKPCVTFRRSSLTAWSGIRTSRKVKMLAPS